MAERHSDGFVVSLDNHTSPRAELGVRLASVVVFFPIRPFPNNKSYTLGMETTRWPSALQHLYSLQWPMAQTHAKTAWKTSELIVRGADKKMFRIKLMVNKFFPTKKVQFHSSRKSIETFGSERKTDTERKSNRIVKSFGQKEQVTACQLHRLWVAECNAMKAEGAEYNKKKKNYKW